MNARLRKIDLEGEILTKLFENGRISEARYLAALKKLTDRAVAIMAKQS